MEKVVEVVEVVEGGAGYLAPVVKTELELPAAHCHFLLPCLAWPLPV